MVLYYNKVCQNRFNAQYPHRVEVKEPEDLENVVRYDHVCAEYKDSYRKNDNFISADCSMFDIDNAESDIEEEWVTPEEVRKAFPDVPFYVSYSRNHMKPKEGKAPRPKFHVYFPDRAFENMGEYKSHKEKVCCYFTAFDQNAKDAARFFFGVEQPKVEFYPGNTLLADFMKRLPEDSTIEDAGKRPKEKCFERSVASNTNIIPKGERNSTLYKYALRVLTRFGNHSNGAYRLYAEESSKCAPPLGDDEVSKIWNNAVKYYNETISVSPGYTPPEQYHHNPERRTQVWDLLDLVDRSAMSELYNIEPSNRKFSIRVAKLFLRAFGVRVRLNEMNRRTEISGLPPEYSGEDSYNTLVTLITDFMAGMSYRRATSPIVFDALSVIANENRYHPVLELLNTELWDGKNRLPDIYHMMGITDDFHKTLVKKWAMQTVAVLYNSDENPIAAQGVLVLQGEQGIGKTQLFRHLAIREQFFKGGATLDMSNKDSLMSATKVWICELGEIDSTTKKEQSALKAFLTEQVDRFREPYARAETVRPRRTAFCGTVNPARYLRDETGNRRYWTIPVKEIDINMVFQRPPEWYAQFWRQVHEAYKRNPEGYLLTKQEQERINESNSDFETELHGEDEFMTMFNTEADLLLWRYKTAAEITDMLNTKFKGLNLKSSTLGRQLIPRLEKRIGKGFARKTVKGKRLIQVPPCGASDFPIEAKELSPLADDDADGEDVLF